VIIIRNPQVQIAELLIVKAEGTYSYHWSLRFTKERRFRRRTLWNVYIARWFHSGAEKARGRLHVQRCVAVLLTSLVNKFRKFATGSPLSDWIYPVISFKALPKPQIFERKIRATCFFIKSFQIRSGKSDDGLTVGLASKGLTDRPCPWAVDSRHSTITCRPTLTSSQTPLSMEAKRPANHSKPSNVDGDLPSLSLYAFVA
jgi:hypothetical protein